MGKFRGGLKWQQIRKRLAAQRVLLIMLIPAVVYYIVFHYVPMWGAQIAFRDYKVLKGLTGSEWVGLANFAKLLKQPSFSTVFRNTVIISTWKLLLGFPAPIVFALLLNELQNIKFKRTVQTISYLPHFISWIVLAGIFEQLLSPTSGPVAALFRMMDKTPIYWLGDKDYFRGVLIATSVWKGFGWGSIVYLAAISGIDQAQYEAALIDGANRFQRVIHITVPGLTPTLTIMLIFAVGNLFTDDFDQIYNLYNTAVMKVGDVLSTYSYRSGIEQNKFSLASAAGLLQNILSFILVLSTNAVAKRINEYGIW